MLHFDLAMRATSPINAIALSNFGDFSSKRIETFDDVWFVHSRTFTTSWQSKSKDTRTGSIKEGTKGQTREQRDLTQTKPSVIQRHGVETKALELLGERLGAAA